MSPELLAAPRRCSQIGRATNGRDCPSPLFFFRLKNDPHAAQGAIVYLVPGAQDLIKAQGLSHALCPLAVRRKKSAGREILNENGHAVILDPNRATNNSLRHGINIQVSEIADSVARRCGKRTGPTLI